MDQGDCKKKCAITSSACEVVHPSISHTCCDVVGRRGSHIIVKCQQTTRVLRGSRAPVTGRLSKTPNRRIKVKKERKKTTTCRSSVLSVQVSKRGSETLHKSWRQKTEALPLHHVGLRRIGYRSDDEPRWRTSADANQLFFCLFVFFPEWVPFHVTTTRETRQERRGVRSGRRGLPAIPAVGCSAGTETNVR